MSTARATLHRLRRAGEALGLGPLAVALLHRPVGRLRDWVRAGGPGGIRRLAAARREMTEAAAQLPPLVPHEGPGYGVSYLTGASVWDQTLFCFVSLYRHAGCALTPILYDDGTLTPEHVGHLRRVVPWAVVVSRAEAEARLDRVLPASAYPTLRARRQSYVHLRKLVDVRAGGDGWRLVLDSDLLFFRRPDALLTWLAAPERPLTMTDFRSSYGYSPSLLSRLAEGPVPDRVNVGVCGLNDAEIDWGRMEAWCRALEVHEGPHYFQEQALVALWLTAQPGDALPPDDYLIRPRPREVRHPEAVMHHYVLDSRRAYVQDAWRGLLAPESPSGARARSLS